MSAFGKQLANALIQHLDERIPIWIDRSIQLQKKDVHKVIKILF